MRAQLGFLRSETGTPQFPSLLMSSQLGFLCEVTPALGTSPRDRMIILVGFQHPWPRTTLYFVPDPENAALIVRGWTRRIQENRTACTAQEKHRASVLFLSLLMTRLASWNESPDIPSEQLRRSRTRAEQSARLVGQDVHLSRDVRTRAAIHARTGTYLRNQTRRFPFHG